MKAIIIPLLFIISFVSFGQYASIHDIPHPKDNGDGFVSDPDDYLSSATEIQLNEIITEIRDEKGFEVAVVIVNSIGNKEPLPFATDLGNEWGVGKGDRGIVILVAVADRNMAIATGYETEKFLPDLVTKQISTDEITPYFKLENYDKGVLNGVQVIRNIVMDENVPEYVAELQELGQNRLIWEMIALAAAVLLIVLSLIISPTKGTIAKVLGILIACTIVSFIAYFWVLKDRHTFSVVWDIFTALLFISVSVNTFIILKEETTKIWPFAVFMTLVVPIPLIGFYVHDMKIVVEIYLIGAGLVFGIFLLSYFSALLTKNAYKKYHRLKLYKLDVFGYLFPLPMYVVDLLVENLLEKWRNQVRYSEKTGLEMRKLSEQDDNSYLERGQVSEERVKSVDYDVWITDEPDDILILSYKSWFSKYSSCSSCGFQTWYLVYDKTISSATYSSSGTGEKKKACAHCKHQDITRYTIPRKVKSSSGGGSYSSGSSFGGSSGGGSFGGGSFGGGGSSSSW
jgi:uncharacterized protein